MESSQFPTDRSYQSQAKGLMMVHPSPHIHRIHDVCSVAKSRVTIRFTFEDLVSQTVFLHRRFMYMPVMRFPPVRVLCVILSIVVNGVVPPRAAAQGGREVATAVYRDPFDQARGYIRQTMETEGIPSVSVAVARAGKILWEQ